MHQPGAQELDKIHVLYVCKFCRPTSGVRVLAQSRYSASIDLVLWCTSEACKYTKCSYNGGHDNFLLNSNIGWKKHSGDVALIASRFSQSISQESFISKWWFSSKVEAWNFFQKLTFKICQSNENRLSTCQLKSEHNHSEKSARIMHISWMMLKNKGH